MDLLYFLMILFYWLFLSGVIFLAGTHICRIYVTGPSGAERFFLGGRNKCYGETVVKYLFFVAILTLLANAIHFVLHCAVMTETQLSEVFSILPLFLTKTKYGRFTILRTLLLAVITVVSFISVMRDRRWATLSGIVLSVLLLVAIAMSGHQGAKGYWNFPFILDVLHLVTVSWWIGGIIFIRFFLSAVVKGPVNEFWQNVKTLINRFSQLATCCVFIAVLSGILLSYANVEELPLLINTQYGVVLLVKIFFVGIIIILGGMNKFLIIPRINKIKKEEASAGLIGVKKLLSLVSVESGLGFAILLLTSLLTHLDPSTP